MWKYIHNGLCHIFDRVLQHHPKDNEQEAHIARAAEPRFMASPTTRPAQQQRLLHTQNIEQYSALREPIKQSRETHNISILKKHIEDTLGSFLVSRAMMTILQICQAKNVLRVLCDDDDDHLHHHDGFYMGVLRGLYARQVWPRRVAETQAGATRHPFTCYIFASTTDYSTETVKILPSSTTCSMQDKKRSRNRFMRLK